ncbi:MAG: hypothetical protein WC759_05660, partial [Candidatus Micrarchaeia archaeon]
MHGSKQTPGSGAGQPISKNGLTLLEPRKPSPFSRIMTNAGYTTLFVALAATSFFVFGTRPMPKPANLFATKPPLVEKAEAQQILGMAKNIGVTTWSFSKNAEGKNEWTSCISFDIRSTTEDVTAIIGYDVTINNGETKSVTFDRARIIPPLSAGNRIVFEGATSEMKNIPVGEAVDGVLNLKFATPDQSLFANQAPDTEMILIFNQSDIRTARLTFSTTVQKAPDFVPPEDEPAPFQGGKVFKWTDQVRVDEVGGNREITVALYSNSDKELRVTGCELVGEDGKKQFNPLDVVIPAGGDGNARLTKVPAGKNLKTTIFYEETGSGKKGSEKSEFILSGNGESKNDVHALIAGS